MMPDYGKCPHCHRVTTVRLDGLIRMHRDTRTRKACEGTSKEPARTYSSEAIAFTAERLGVTRPQVGVMLSGAGDLL